MKEIFDITESAYRYKDKFLIATGKEMRNLASSTLAKQPINWYMFLAFMLHLR